MTEKTLPTAGDWTAAVAKFKGGDYIGVGVLGTQKIVAICGLCKADDELESCANAFLIAAAKELFSALQQAEMAMLGYTHRNDVIDAALLKARAAIEKATTGEMGYEPMGLGDRIQGC